MPERVLTFPPSCHYRGERRYGGIEPCPRRVHGKSMSFVVKRLADLRQWHISCKLRRQLRIKLRSGHGRALVLDRIRSEDVRAEILQGLVSLPVSDFKRGT